MFEMATPTPTPAPLLSPAARARRRGSLAPRPVPPQQVLKTQRKLNWKRFFLKEVSFYVYSSPFKDTGLNYLGPQTGKNFSLSTAILQDPMVEFQCGIQNREGPL